MAVTASSKTRGKPDWIDVLRTECERLKSQAKVGLRIGYSSTVINQVLKGTYKGDLAKVQAKVEGALMGATVDCPVVGEIPRNRCIENQGRPFAATNPTRVQIYHACRNGCRHSSLGGDQ